MGLFFGDTPVQNCGNCHLVSPDEALICPRCGVDLTQNSETTLARKRLQANDRVSMIRLSVGDMCCPVCSSSQGAYAKDKVPHLPIQGCSHALGCRCFYEPVLLEIYP